MTVLGRGLVFQPVLASLLDIQAYTCDNDTIMTLQEKADITKKQTNKEKKKGREKTVDNRRKRNGYGIKTESTNR